MDIYLIGEVGWEITLDSVVNQLKDLKEDDVLDVYIHSAGGSVYDGLAIYNHLKNLTNEVNTHSSGLVASIASIIFMAGKERTINSTDSFLIHLPSGAEYGNAKDLEKYAEELRQIEDKLAGIYAMETDLTAEEAIDVMNKDAFLEIDYLQEKGFVTQVKEFKAVATLNKNNMQNNFTKEQAEGLFQKFEKTIKNLLAPKSENKMLFSANNDEVEFYELGSDEEVIVGSKAKISGDSAEGEFVMQSGETYIFAKGELVEIKEPKSDESELEEAVAQLKQENADLQNKVEELTNELTQATDAKNELQDKFNQFKGEIMSNFDADPKVTTAQEPKSRTLRNKK